MATNQVAFILLFFGFPIAKDGERVFYALEAGVNTGSTRSCSSC